MSSTTTSPPPPAAGDHPRVLLRGFLSPATGYGHLLLPFVPVHERLHDVVESFFDCRFDLFIKFTGVVSNHGRRRSGPGCRRAHAAGLPSAYAVLGGRHRALTAGGNWGRCG
uniref:Uncharacterized protein n=1 Tax=Zea mays TaxID=4577 RepID=A0A804QZ11_MAIZE